MPVTVTTIAPTLRLTTRAKVKAALAITANTDDAFLDDLIDQASQSIASYCHRIFGREAVTETTGGYGDIHLMLTRTPIVSVSAVSRDSEVITDYSIGSAEQGLLYRRAGWTWTAQAFPGLSAGGALWDRGSPLPLQEEPQFSVSYVGGYILPSQYLVSAVTVSADASDDSFNDAANGFPALLKTGDVIETAGFQNAANNGRFLVTGTPTVSKIVTTGTLTTEAAGGARTVLFRPPAVCRPLDDVEKAAIECVKTWFIERKDDPNVEEKQVGPMRVRYGARGGNTIFSVPQALPSVCIGLLRSWVRSA